MTTLYDPRAFDRLTETAWDTDEARAGIAEIVADADAAFDEDGLWPAGEWDAWQTPTPLQTLYVGAAGVVWALDALRRRGFAETRLDLAGAARLTLASWRREPSLMRGVELPEPARAGLLSGEAGILAVAYLLDPSDDVADELYELVCENVGNPRAGVMWGSPGTMLAARAMLDRTGEERWAAAWRESATTLLEARDADGLWEQWLYGRSLPGLDPPPRAGRQCPLAARRRGRARRRDPHARHCRRPSANGAARARFRELAELRRRAAPAGRRAPAAAVVRWCARDRLVCSLVPG